MSEEVFNRPDEEKLWTLLEENPYELSTVVIYLAWREGLTRREIWELRWDQVDYDAGFLRLPDRSVPLEERTARQLQYWRSALGANRDISYVASSLKRRSLVAEQSISRLARTALDGAGMEDVRLIDLRHDYVRRMLETYDWTYALRVAGISVTTYRALYAAESGHGNPTVPSETPADEKAEQMWRLLQENRGSAAGIGLWLSQQAYLKHDEIIGLTWDMVDLERGILHLERGDIYMIKEVIDVLREEKARRAPGDDPHVILSPKSRKPIDRARLSTIMRDLMVHGGLEDVYANTLRYSAEMERERERILSQARLAGGVTRKDVERLLGVKPFVAYSRLADLVQDGLLVGTSKGYFPAEQTIPPEKREEAVTELIAERGSITAREAAELLHTGKYTANRLLRHMVAAGDLVTIRDKGLFLLSEKVKISRMLQSNNNKANA